MRQPVVNETPNEREVKETIGEEKEITKREDFRSKGS
ncbi:hypothetical protein K144313037_07500 [Clostridium tetani]|nr:hypothetical protein K144313037_07500 [Clostridium tetani]BDR77820.1 hypothetical protein K154307017_07530 [Clostridium tetani]BDR83345.1 hypothetical protein K254310026_07560 [Clostridium tetani]BEV18895.1 hypothetical protein K154301001_07500 [Clostridium tetani]SUY54948.1 Uncharacterised protein [Clostridium tetani]